MASTRRLQIDGEIRECRAELEALGIGGRVALGTSGDDAFRIVKETDGLLKSIPVDASAPPLIQAVHKGLVFVLGDATKLKLIKADKFDKHELRKAHAIAEQLSRYLSFIPIITAATEKTNAGLFDSSATKISELAAAYIASNSLKIADLKKLFKDIGDNLKSITGVGPEYTALLGAVGTALSP